MKKLIYFSVIFLIILPGITFSLDNDWQNVCNSNGVCDGLETKLNCSSDCAGPRLGISEHHIQVENYYPNFPVSKQLEEIDYISPETARIFINWNNCLNSPTEINVSGCQKYKNLVISMQEQEIEIVGLNAEGFYPFLTGVNTWRTVPQRNLNPNSTYQKFLDDYEKSWETFANYFSEINIWETGNEYNHCCFLKIENENGFDFYQRMSIITDLMYRSNRGIKKVNPDSKTFTPGFATVDKQDTVDISGVKYTLDQIYKNIKSGNWPSTNKRDYFDGIAWHMHNFDITTNNISMTNFMSAGHEIYSVIKSHGDYGIPVILTESGVSDKFNSTNYDASANWLQIIFRKMKLEYDWLWGVHWFKLVDFDERNPNPNNKGILTSPTNGYPKWKPIAYTLESLLNNSSSDNLSYTYELSTPGNMYGFTSTGVNNFKSVGGFLVGDSFVNAPIILSPIISINSNNAKKLEFRMSSNCGDRGRFYFITNNDKIWNESKAKWFVINGDRRMHTYTIALDEISTWKDTIKQFRIIPTNGLCEFRIDSIRFYDEPVCTSFTYSDWSTCKSNGTQTRTVLGKGPNDCKGGNPITTQTCNYTPPTPTCTTNDWSSTDTTCQPDNTLTRTWTKNTNCEGGTTHPATETITCNYQAPTCTETNFEYTDWFPSICPSNGIQTRTTTKLIECNGNPTQDLIRTCTYTPPTPTCTESFWNATLTECDNGKQTKTWVKIGECINGIQHQNETITCKNSVNNYLIPTIKYCGENDWKQRIEPTNCPENGKQTIYWDKTNTNCVGGIIKKPIETINCKQEQNSQIENKNNNNQNINNTNKTEDESLTENQCTINDWDYEKLPEVCPQSGEQLIYWTKNSDCKGGLEKPSSEIIECEPEIPNTFNFIEELIKVILSLSGIR